MEDLRNIQRRRLKLIAGILCGIFALALGATYFISQPSWFRGEVLEQLGTPTVPTTDIFIPTNYQAAPGQIGEIELKTGSDLSINAMEFTLAYDKNLLEVREVVLNGTPLYTFTDSVNPNAAQGANVVLVSPSAVDVPPGTIVQIKIAVADTVSEGTEIPIQIVNPVIYDASLIETVPTTTAGKITVAGAAVEGTEIAVNSISPSTINNSTTTDLVIMGQNFFGSNGTADSLQVYLNDTNQLQIITASDTQITALVPSGLVPDIAYSLFIDNDQDPDGIRIDNAVAVVTGETAQISIVSEHTKMIPAQIPNDGVTPATLFVALVDPNGIDDLIPLDITDPFQPVIANLGPLNQDINVPMEFAGKVGNMAIFRLDITVDQRVATSETPYEIEITARNRIGHSTTGILEVLVSRDIRDSIPPKIIQAHASPEEAISGKQIVFYAEIEDEDGCETDIQSVTLNLLPLGSGLGPISLVPMDLAGLASPPIAATPPPPAAEGEEASPLEAVASNTSLPIEKTRCWYTSPGELVIPDEVIAKTYDLALVATDISGESDSEEIKLRVLSPEEVAFKPEVISEESYTTPLAAINDDTTPITLYALIEHKNPLASVIVNLGNVARVQSPQTAILPTNVPPTPPTTGLAADVFDTIGVEEGLPPPAIPPGGTPPPAGAMCPTNSDTIVCMDLTARIGKEKTWATLPNVVIRPHISPSIDPYIVQVIATDIYGQAGEGYVPIIVHDGDTYTSDNVAPQVKLATATTPENIEVVFSEALDPGTVSPSGRNFAITFEDDISIRLPVEGATINAAGTIVTLKTAPQEEGRYYSVTADTRITDSIGIPIVRGGNDKARFIGFIPSDYPVRLDYVTATSPESVELEFHKPIRPSSIELTAIKPGGAAQAPTLGARMSRKGSSNFRIQNAETGQDLGVTSVEFGPFGNIIVLGTDIQKAGQKYFVNVRDIATYAGVYTKASGITKFFKGFVKPFASLTELWNQADFDQNGVVNFADFTIFASMYGKEREVDIQEGTAPEVMEPTSPPVPTPETETPTDTATTPPTNPDLPPFEIPEEELPPVVLPTN